MNIIEYLEQISITEGMNAKQQILKKLIVDNPEVIEVFKEIFLNEPFGLNEKTIKKAEILENALTTTISNKEIIEIIKKVKQLSGNELISYLTILNNFDDLSKKWITRILCKNLRCGISLTSINKVLTQLNTQTINRFGVQLCGKITKPSEWFEYPCYVSTKYDGFRCVISKVGQKIQMTSRQGKTVDFVPEITNELLKFNFDFVFDGEIIAKNFNEIQTRIGRKIQNLNKIEGLKYVVFDILSLNNTDVKCLTEQDRYRMLRLNLAEFRSEFIKLEKRDFCYSLQDLERLYNEAIENNEEGVVIKRLHRPYEDGSRTNWIKLKPILEHSFRVIDVYPGTGKYENTIGSILVTDKYSKVYAKVGSGLTDLIRIQLERRLADKSLIDSIVDVKYNEITSNKNGTYSLRFPRFLKFRDDKLEPDEVKR